VRGREGGEGGGGVRYLLGRRAVRHAVAKGARQPASPTSLLQRAQPTHAPSSS
jgi:hypothetical protein